MNQRTTAVTAAFVLTCLTLTSFAWASPDWVRPSLSREIEFTKGKPLVVSAEFMEVLETALRQQAQKAQEERDAKSWENKIIDGMTQTLKQRTGVSTALQAEQKLRSALLTDEEGTELLMVLYMLHPDQRPLYYAINDEEFNTPLWNKLKRLWLMTSLQHKTSKDISAAILQRLKAEKDPDEAALHKLMQNPVFGKYDNIFLIALRLFLERELENAPDEP